MTAEGERLTSELAHVLFPDRASGEDPVRRRGFAVALIPPAGHATERLSRLLLRPCISLSVDKRNWPVLTLFSNTTY